jgi:GNAT superfamily N-acetyltransferase
MDKWAPTSVGVVLTVKEICAMTDPVILAPDQIYEEERQAIIAPLGKFSEGRGFAFRPRAVGLVLRAGDAIVGGLLGDTNWDWLHIDILSVAAHLRGRGYGRQLMERAEALARERGCGGAWVDTYSFQSPGFYQRLGYRVFGTLPSYPGAEQRIFLMKTLSP